MCGFIYNIIIANNPHKIDTELPFADIQGIKEFGNKIYVGSGVYRRVQVYNLNGELTKIIDTNNGNKDFDFWVIGENKVKINQIIFNKKDSSIYDKEYSLSSRFPLTISKNGYKIITQPLHMSFWAGPYTPWLFSAASIFLLMLINSIIIMDVFGSDIPKNKKGREFLKRIYK